MIDNFLFFALFAATQIIVETMPISSSSHVALLTSILGIGLSKDLVALNDLLYGPMLVVLIIVFFKAWWPITTLTLRALKHLLMHRPISFLEKKALTHFWSLMQFAIIADGITSIAYGIKWLFFLINTNLSPHPYFLIFGLTLTMVMLLATRWLQNPQDRRALNLNVFCQQNVSMGQIPETSFLFSKKNALLMGIAQSTALLVPGVSRFAATFFTATLLGLTQYKALKLSFVVFLPIMAASFFIKGIPFAITHAHLYLTLPALIVYSISTIIATITFAGTYNLACKNRLWWFGIYMLIPLGIALWIVSL